MLKAPQGLQVALWSGEELSVICLISYISRYYQKKIFFTTIIIFSIKTDLVNKGTVAQTEPQIYGDTLLGFSFF